MSGRLVDDSSAVVTRVVCRYCKLYLCEEVEAGEDRLRAAVTEGWSVELNTAAPAEGLRLKCPACAAVDRGLAFDAALHRMRRARAERAL